MPPDPLPEFPSFGAHVAPLISARSLILRTDATTYATEDPTIVALAQLLDGRTHIDRLVARLAGEFPAELVFLGIDRLLRLGVIVDGPPPDRSPQTVHWHGRGVSRAEADVRLAACTVEFRSFMDQTVDPFAQAVRDVGMSVGAPGDVLVAVVDDLLNPVLDRIAAEESAQGRNWLVVRPVGEFALVGPIHGPGGACRECLSFWLRDRAWADGYLAARFGQASPPPRGALSSQTGMAAHALAANLAELVVLGSAAILDRRILSVGPQGQQRIHACRRHHRCASCATAAEAEAGLLDDLAGPVTGLVDDPQEIATEHAGPVHVFSVLQPRLDRAESVRITGTVLRHEAAFGRGVTHEEARRSCIAEAVERYSTCYRPGDEVVRARPADLQEPHIDPVDVQGFSAAQYAARETTNSRRPVIDRVPEPYDGQSAIAWCRARSLTSEATCLVPTAYCHFGYPDDPDRRFIRPSSNGCAAGVNFEDAAVRGLLELVERDAAAIWWYNRIQRPAHDLGVLDDPLLDDLQYWLRQRHRAFAVLDLTTDLGIPVAAAISWKTAGRSGLLFGFGAGVTHARAARHAATEMYQLLAITGSDDWRKGATKADDASAMAVMRAWLDQETLDTQPHLAPCGGNVVAIPVPGPDERAKPLRWVTGRLHASGMHSSVLDMTRTDIGNPVVRAIVPGLRHFWARFAPGRLYSVPVQLGWRSSETEEAALNPVPMFI